MIIAALVAAVFAIVTIAVLVAARRSAPAEHQRDAPPASNPNLESERADLEQYVTGHVWSYLNDPGIWVPDGPRVETLFAPLEGVGGDFIGTVPRGAGGVAFIGDVNGHGLDAALVALRVKDTIQEQLRQGADLGETTVAANELLYDEVPGVATLFLCSVAGADLEYVNAGHEPPLVLDAAETEIEGTGPMLGVTEFGYRTESIRLDPEERVLAYTDGVTQAYGARGGLSTEQLRAVVSEPGHLHDLVPAVDALFEEPRRDDIAALEITSPPLPLSE